MAAPEGMEHTAKFKLLMLAIRLGFFGFADMLQSEIVADLISQREGAH